MQDAEYERDLSFAQWLWGYLGYEDSQPWTRRTPANEEAALTMARTIRAYIDGEERHPVSRATFEKDGRYTGREIARNDGSDV